MPLDELTPEQSLITVADEVATPLQEVYTPVYPLDYLYRSDDFRSRIEEILDTSVVAKVIFKLYTDQSSVIEADPNAINFVGVSVDDPTKISYLNYSRIKSAMDKNESTKIWGDKNYRYHASSSKVVRKLFSYIKSKNSIYFNAFMQTLFEDGKVAKNYSDLGPNASLVEVFTEQDFDIFNNQFRLQGFRQGDGGEVIRVRGHWIAEMYHEKNYASLSGSLGNSCMRYEKCQRYLDIYTKNLGLCSLAVILNSEGKLQARSLVWNINGQEYYDRIYSTSDILIDRMHAYFLTQNIPSCFGGYNTDISLQIKEDLLHRDFDKRVLLNFDYYPYMDTFRYLSEDRDCLYNYDPNESYLELSSTSGGYEENISSTFECHNCGRAGDADDSCYIDIGRDEHAHEDLCSYCAVYSEYYNTYITHDNSISVPNRRNNSDMYVLDEDATELYDGNYCLQDDAVELIDGNYAYVEDEDLQSYQDGDYFILSQHEFVEYDGCYYKPDDCVTTKDNELVPIEYTTEVNGEYWIIEDWEKEQNLNLI